MPGALARTGEVCLAVEQHCEVVVRWGAIAGVVVLGEPGACLQQLLLVKRHLLQIIASPDPIGSCTRVLQRSSRKSDLQEDYVRETLLSDDVPDCLQSGLRLNAKIKPGQSRAV